MLKKKKSLLLISYAMDNTNAPVTKTPLLIIYTEAPILSTFENTCVTTPQLQYPYQPLT
jgi:hypothetical protein